jgi:uncharacterized protein
MHPGEPRHFGDVASNGESNESARGLLAVFERHPITSSVVIFVADVAIAILVGRVATALLHPLPNTSGVPGLPDFIALCAVALLTAILVTVLGWWRTVGYNRPAQWRSLGLLLLPTLLALLPLVRGFKAVDAGIVLFLLVGYLLTGFHEETIYRGVLLRVLRPTGLWPALLISSLLFGLAHSANLFLRFSGNPVIVILQIIGNFTFGIGMAALRLRINTIWPLLFLHAAFDLFLALGQLPTLLVAPIQDVILLIYAFFLIWGMRRKGLWGQLKR